MLTAAQQTRSAGESPLLAPSASVTPKPCEGGSEEATRALSAGEGSGQTGLTLCPHLSLRRVWVICVLALVFGYVCTPASFALDLWQHLSLGREMACTHHLVTADPFTHTLAGQPVLNQNWLAQVCLYLCFRAGGIEAVTLLVAGLYTTAFAAMMYVCWTRCHHTRVAVGCTLLAAAIASENLSIRTQVFSALCLSLELLVLWSDRLAKRRPLIVGAIVLLWTNSHGAFALGVALPTLFAAGRALTLLIRIPQPRSLAWKRLLADAQFRSFAFTAVCAAVAVFCNPHPAHTLAYLSENIGAGLRRNIQEWQPIPFASITGKFFFGSIVLLLLVLNWSRRRLNATEALLLVAFLCLGAKAWRMAIWWGFVLAPVLAAHLAALLPAEGPERHATRSQSLLNWAFLLIVLTMAGLCLPWSKSHNPILPAARRAAHPPDEPHALARFLSRRGTQGNAFNSMEWGGYLIWHLDGRLKLFVDGRIDPFPDSVWSDYQAISAGRADWEDLLHRYQVTTLIADRATMPALINFARQSTRWKEVYSDPLAVVFKENTLSD